MEESERHARRELVPVTKPTGTMNKGELAARLAQKTGLSKAKSLEVINALFSAEKGEGIIAIELDAGRKVVVPGFGTFGTRKRAARMGTNPASGKKIDVVSKSYAYFKPGKALRERLEK
jgi:DNA-binding protein HU-beta